MATDALDERQYQPTSMCSKVNGSDIHHSKRITAPDPLLIQERHPCSQCICDPEARAKSDGCRAVLGAPGNRAGWLAGELFAACSQSAQHLSQSRGSWRHPPADMNVHLQGCDRVLLSIWLDSLSFSGLCVRIVSFQCADKRRASVGDTSHLFGSLCTVHFSLCRQRRGGRSLLTRPRAAAFGNQALELAHRFTATLVCHCVLSVSVRNKTGATANRALAVAAFDTCRCARKGTLTWTGRQHVGERFHAFCKVLPSEAKPKWLCATLLIKAEPKLSDAKRVTQRVEASQVTVKQGAPPRVFL